VFTLLPVITIAACAGSEVPQAKPATKPADTANAINPLRIALSPHLSTQRAYYDWRSPRQRAAGSKRDLQSIVIRIHGQERPGTVLSHVQKPG
jgi:hypothetical protein